MEMYPMKPKRMWIGETMHCKPEQMQQKATLNVVDYSDPFAIHDLLESLDTANFRTKAKEIEVLCARKMQMLHPYFEVILRKLSVGLLTNDPAEVSDIHLHVRRWWSRMRKLSNFNSFVGMAVAGFQKEISFCLRKMEARKGHGVKASGKEETFTIILF
ncbi:hypothetical protein CK203_069599 [Vitis vinifera]|uniref:Uncharacterized protein n=1 Tax=Vitis vinifera TaxID=29760 RepID=A0A438EL15_VITVI|nr:hypothetical protein CK203_069599 [Vitis vinifera]